MIWKLYKYLNILSLDVVVGACVCSVFVQKLLHVQQGWPSLLSLGLTVWVIYTYDHIMDARNVSHAASSERHRFHQKHYKMLATLVIIILLVIAFLVSQLPVLTLEWGASLASLVLVYFVLLYILKLKSSYHKEILIALLYACGVMIGPVSIYQGDNISVVLVAYLQLCLLAFSNLIIFSLYEWNIDKQDNFPSIVRIWGYNGVERLAKSLIIIQLAIVLIVLLKLDMAWFEYTLLSMLIIFTALVWRKSLFAQREYYRFLGDAVFLFPLIPLLFS